jgi:hypothetical protein
MPVHFADGDATVWRSWPPLTVTVTPRRTPGGLGPGGLALNAASRSRAEGALPIIGTVTSYGDMPSEGQWALGTSPVCSREARAPDRIILCGRAGYCVLSSS